MAQTKPLNSETILRPSNVDVSEEQQKSESEALKSGKTRFFFPEHDIIVIAEDHGSAEAAVLTHLKTQAKKEDSSDD